MKVSARRWLANGIASRYIKHADIKPGDKFYLICRVSGRVQGRRNNLADQEANLREQVEQRGGVVVGVLRIVKSGFDPYWLGRVVNKARKLGAKLLAETAERFIRHPAYHSKQNTSCQARDCDLRELAACTERLPLATILHPDATPQEVRSYQRQRGQRMKNAKGGRPERPKNRKERLCETVRQLRHNGTSFRQIEKATGVPFNTARRWCQ